MSDTTVYFRSTDTTIYFASGATTVYFPSCPPASLALSALTTLLNEYPNYPNDAAARLAGLTTGNLYWFSLDTDAGIYNTLKRVSIL